VNKIELPSGGHWLERVLAIPGLRGVSRRLMRAAGDRLALPLDLEVKLNLGERPQYTYCVYHAAQLARRLGLKAISVIEFGVAGGNGLLFLDRLSPRVEQATGIKIEVYGFDTGMGLPEVAAPEDLPYWFQPSQYEMNVPKLQAQLASAKLVLGNVAATVGDFFERYRPAPVGAIFNDLDLYTSTRDSLKLLDTAPEFFLPRLFFYFDDVVGTELEMYSECNGQLLAISEFNRTHDTIHIGMNRNLLVRTEIEFRYQIYYGHLSSHPRYLQYVGSSDQERMESLLALKAPCADSRVAA
jgi:hypothetical protein